MNLNDLKKQREQILQTAQKHGAVDVRVFGSVASGNEQKSSDIDFLVNTTENTSPFFPGGLIVDLEELLQQKVDVLTEDGLYPAIKERILNGAVPL